MFHHSNGALSRRWMAILVGSGLAVGARGQDAADGPEAHPLSSSPATWAALRDEVESAVPALMEEHRVPGVSIAVFEDGAITWAEGYGLLERGSDRPVTTDTLFQAASISKPVAAFGALRMVENGELELDTPVNELLLAWQVPGHDFESDVTLRRLVSHTAGLTVHGFPGYDARKEAAHLLDILDGVEPANTPAIFVDVAPGSLWRYSGGGYCVLQMLMMDVTEREFPELLQELVLEPLGMDSSTYAQPLPEEWHARAAHGHGRAGAALECRWHSYPEMAAAGLWTTPSDLARFALGVCAAARDEGAALGAEWADAMLTPQTLTDGEIAPAGLGVFLRENGTVFEHGGSNFGFKCQLVCNHEHRTGFAAMTNGDRGSAVIQELMTLLRPLLVSEGEQAKR